MDPQRIIDDAAQPRRANRDGLAAVIAALIGVLALFVSGYTAYVQRQQVRAQVWPYLLVANYSNEFSIKVLNKGVGPAIIRSMQIWIDGKPQKDWKHVTAALGLPPTHTRTATVNDNVLSANEAVPMIALPDDATYQRFRDASRDRLGMEICFCSTLDECWLYSDRTPGVRPTQLAIESCPRIPETETFDD